MTPTSILGGLYAKLNDIMTPINTPVIHQQYPIPISVVLGYLSIITLCVTSLALPLPPRTLKFINRSIILPLIILVCVYIYRTCCMHIEDSPGHRFGMPSHAIGENNCSFFYSFNVLNRVNIACNRYIALLR